MYKPETVFVDKSDMIMSKLLCRFLTSNVTVSKAGTGYAFIEKVWDEEPKLQVIKTSNDAAPVWAKGLKEMERRK